MFSNLQYKRLLDGLELSLFPKITETRQVATNIPGHSREPVLFQIDHGTAHLCRVRDNMSVLLTAAKSVPNKPFLLHDMHCFIALTAAMFHDLGMHYGWYALLPDIKEPPTLADADEIRKKHGAISAAWFHLAPSAQPPKLQLAPDLLEILSDEWLNKVLTFVIEAHQWSTARLEDELEKNFSVLEERSTVRVLVCLVKLADTLDMDQRRVNVTTMKGMIEGLLGQPSDIHGQIDDISRFLMVYYLHNLQCRPLDKAEYVLQITLDLRVNSAMIEDSKYKPFLDYLTRRYSERLIPSDSYVPRVLKNELGVVFTQVIIPQFKRDPAVFKLPLELLDEILDSIKIRDACIEPALLLEDWVKSRWAAQCNGGIQPAWEEFKNEEIILDEGNVKALDSIFEIGDVALILAKGACGKSVFAVGYAVRWIKETGGKVFWLDLREQDQLVKERNLDLLDAFQNLQISNKLLIIDNVHVDDRYVIDFLDRSKRRPGGRYLFLGRPSIEDANFQYANLRQRLMGSCLEFVANADAFFRTAARLQRRSGLQVNWGDKDYRLWQKEFGGDLIAFSQAVRLALETGVKPSRDHVVVDIRKRFLDVAESSPGGLESFLYLCAMSSLDLTAQDNVLGGNFSDLYPNISFAGLAVPMMRGYHRHWQFIHAGLAELILHAAARCSKNELQEFILKKLIGASVRNPYSLGFITINLASKQYGGKNTLEAWHRLVSKETGLLEQFVASAPTWASPMEKLGFVANREFITTKLTDTLVSALRHTSPSDVVTFLKNLGEEHAQQLLHYLLDDDVYFGVLRRSQPQFVITFFNYLGEIRAKPLLDRLLEGNAYIDVLRRTPPQFVVTFFKYLGEIRAKPLLDHLLEGNAYIDVLRRTPPHFVVNFLKYIDKEKAQQLLEYLLEGDCYFEVLRRTPPGDVITLFRYLGEERAKPLLDKLLEGQAYFDILRRTPPHFVVSFFKYLGEERTQSLLIPLLEDEHFFEVLRYSSPTDVVTFCKYIGDESARPLLYRLLRDVTFVETLCTVPVYLSVTLFKYLGKERAEPLLDRLLNAPTFLDALCKTPPAGMATLFKYLGEEGSKPLLNRLQRDDAFIKALCHIQLPFIRAFLRGCR